MVDAAAPAGVDSSNPVLTRRILFRQLGDSSVTTAVANRIRAAIGAGLLADGERLPREADLANQLGVTAFALREALSSLRGEGLITTRPGRNGGSFVQIPRDITSLARQALGRLSASELGDMGDWQRMLVGQAALLAAQRSPHSSIERMRSYAAEVGSADSLLQARRAYGRFHLELAAAAQSAHLTRAALQMNEEFALIASPVLSDESTKVATCQSLVRIIDAIENRDGDRAREAGEGSQSVIVSHLVRLRLQMLAAQAGALSALPHGRSVRFGHQVDAFCGDLLLRLKMIADLVAPTLGAGGPQSSIRALVGRAIMADMSDVDRAVYRVDVMAEVGQVTGHEYWLDCWSRAADGQFERDSRHVTDPNRADFYDYQNHELMAVPRRSGLPWAAGPYVDFGGVDEYVLTVSMPIIHDGDFVGTAAVDILVGELERKFAGAVATSESPTVLMNCDSRVIVSGSSLASVGSIVPERDIVAGERLANFGWQIGTLTS